MNRYPLWSYYSISAIDAPIISIGWYLYFSNRSTEACLNINYCLILGFSVWLGYMADRLFDIRSKNISTLPSLRHKFCKENESKLWRLWALISAITLILSIASLNSEKFVACFALFVIIAIYNLINQNYIFKRFPKEICVALIFAGGTFTLIDYPIIINDFIQFSIICFLNCLTLTYKDRAFDKIMGVHSCAREFNHRSITIVATLSCMYCLIANNGMPNPIFLTCLACTALHIKSNSFNEEHYRLLTEITYALVPFIAVILSRLP